MKTDLDQLMAENGMDAMLITGPLQHNPYMVYLTGGGHVTQADLIQKRGEAPVLFHGSMERDEAAKTGLQTRSYSLYPFADLMKEAEGDRLLAMALRYKRMFEDVGVTRGKVALYGQTDIGRGYAVLDRLSQLMPDVELVGYPKEDFLLRAMATKEENELERIRRMGEVTTTVVGMVADLLTSSPVRGEVLLRADGEPLTIRDVKAKINLWLAERGAENPEDTIFAIGHDAGVPHSSGNPADVLRLGQTLVFDIFPNEAGGGYFYDFTRTWSLGYATDEALKLYEQVLSVYQTLVSEMEVGKHFPHYQKRTCELFEAMGHPTVMSQPETEVGYVHSLGHGVGLFIHELPSAGVLASPKDALIPGAVFTLEPGLYYPERGLGVRIEDTYTVTPDGKFTVLGPVFPYDLVLPMKKTGGR